MQIQIHMHSEECRSKHVMRAVNAGTLHATAHIPKTARLIEKTETLFDGLGLKECWRNAGNGQGPVA